MIFFCTNAHCRLLGEELPVWTVDFLLGETEQQPVLIHLSINLLRCEVCRHCHCKLPTLPWLCLLLKWFGVEKMHFILHNDFQQSCNVYKSQAKHQDQIIIYNLASVPSAQISQIAILMQINTYWLSELWILFAVYHLWILAILNCKSFAILSVISN